MKKILCAIFLAGFLSSCGLGNSLGNSAGSSAGSASSIGGGGSSSAGSSLFGRRNRAQTTTTTTIDKDGRGLISTIKLARFERTRDGGIIHATGIASRQGYYDAGLVAPDGLVPNEQGVIVLEFRAKEPQFQTATSTERSREIDVGLFISAQKLAASKSILVVGRQNQINIRR
jgi:hypothetical protein